MGVGLASISQPRVHIGAMDGGMAPRSPTGSDTQKSGMVGIADVNVTTRHSRALRLRVAAQAKIGIAFQE